jgi:small subunit ribosomal protein S9
MNSAEKDRTQEHASAGEESKSGSAHPTPELTLGSGAPAEATDESQSAPRSVRGRIDRFGVAMGTGRRKTSVARVRIRKGSGKLTINDRPLEDFFRIEKNRAMIENVLRSTDTFGKVDVWVRAQGGGTTGQAGAVVLGMARALQVMDPGLHQRLSEGGFLTRDSRMVERKKYGKKKARRSFQFSKR